MLNFNLPSYNFVRRLNLERYISTTNIDYYTESTIRNFNCWFRVVVNASKQEVLSPFWLVAVWPYPLQSDLTSLSYDTRSAFFGIRQWWPQIMTMTATGNDQNGPWTKTAQTKRPINFQYDQNGPCKDQNDPAIHPKRPTAKSKAAYEPKWLTVIKKLHSVFSSASFFSQSSRLELTSCLAAIIRLISLRH